MTWQTCIVIALYVLSAVLPVTGLIGLLGNAKREAREYAAVEQERASADPNWFQMEVSARFAHRSIPRRPRAILNDFIFIGLGVVAGAAASIWTIFL